MSASMASASSRRNKATSWVCEKGGVSTERNVRRPKSKTRLPDDVLLVEALDVEALEDTRRVKGWALETLVLHSTTPDAEDEQDDGTSWSTWPKVITDALGRLSSLRDLTMRYGTVLEDVTFSLARHLPRLQSFTFDDQLGNLSSLFDGGPSLRFLDLALDETGLAAAGACVRTLESLVVGSYFMDRVVVRRRVQELGALFDSKVSWS